MKNTGLIYDVGMHNGDDTAYYLRSGYRVLAIEADPVLVNEARQRFGPELQAGQLTILNIGIAQTSGKATFWICDSNTVWNSFNREVASRNGSTHHAIEVQTLRFADLLERYGTPYYLKIDIEGNDILCIVDLRGHTLPQFLSAEAECLGDDGGPTDRDILMTLNALREVGYKRFKLISQRDFLALKRHTLLSVARTRLCDSMVYGKLSELGLSSVAKPFTWEGRCARLRTAHRYAFPPGSTGPFGPLTDGKWLAFAEARETFLDARARYFRHSNRPSFSFWCDWHATY